MCVSLRAHAACCPLHKTFQRLHVHVACFQRTFMGTPCCMLSVLRVLSETPMSKNIRVACPYNSKHMLRVHYKEQPHGCLYQCHCISSTKLSFFMPFGRVTVTTSPFFVNFTFLPLLTSLRLLLGTLPFQLIVCGISASSFRQ